MVPSEGGALRRPGIETARLSAVALVLAIGRVRLRPSEGHAKLSYTPQCTPGDTAAQASAREPCLKVHPGHEHVDPSAAPTEPEVAGRSYLRLGILREGVHED